MSITKPSPIKISEWEKSKCSCCGKIDMFYNPITKENYTRSEIEDIIMLEKESVEIVDWEAVYNAVWWIVQSKTYRVINGVTIDIMTAGVIVTVWEALGESNKEKLKKEFEEHGIGTVGNVCWTVYGRAKAR